MQGIPTSKATQTAQIIRESIQRGEWVEFLPGERTLAKELMISRACLRQALAILTQEKVLAPVEKSKRRSIRQQSDVPKQSDKVVFFTPEPAHRAAPIVLEQVAQLRHYLSKENKTVEWLSSPVFRNPQTTDLTIQQITSSHPHAHWILHQSPQHIQQWFAQSDIRCSVFGSLFPAVSLPCIDIDFYSASRHATGHLLAKGHQRIGLIRFRSQLAGDNLAMQGMLDAIHAHGGDAIPPPVELSHNFHTERLTSALDQLYASSRRPSALIIVNHHHFITSFTHLISRGLQVPKDVSLISLSHDSILDCFSPLPTCYSVGNRLIRNLAQMIINPASQTKPALLIPELRSGKTVSLIEV
ncbi:substrate-binding domain-containing protein [Verrucomicrobiaceae bacterium N1E253]|uniref:Substrate-binding domain-containing protein n=1 Tax=Oceaniferula marina TaxID=2748318 RepID=A0A851GHQ6_9BACT|nr:substrate-binding domain-containing protein [Oceaniferula marina]NWK54765.1 substrate-binding domain-containing protein [Oceaniferula marina]